MQCRICGNEAKNQEYEAREMMIGHRDVHHYFQCSRCGCLQIREFPSDMDKYYQNSYYSFQPSQPKSAFKRRLIAWRDKYAVFKRGLAGRAVYWRYPTAQYEFLQPIRTRLHPGFRILDVGCGAGQLLHSLREIGFQNLLGIDPYIGEDIQYKNGLAIRRLSIHEIDGPYDLIMFHHSFEHVRDPAATIRSAFALLIPGGDCIIRIPIVSSHAWEHYGVHWVQLDAPRHFFLHSTASMSLLSRNAGFELCGVIHDSTAFQFWGSEQYSKDIPLNDARSYGRNPRASIFSEADIAGYRKRAAELNAAKAGDQAIFHLRKPAENSG
jgi:SAM-dependent methyltransferase